MLYKQIGWVNHDGNGIFSIDVHPTHSKFVTAGQGENGTGLVIIWNLGPVLNKDLERSENVHRSLLRLEMSACVNCARWSKRGTMLACGGDEQIVTIWEYVGKLNSAGTLGEKSTNVEQWRCVHKLRYHSADILHVDWSPDEKHLASASVDNKVVIWDAHKFEKLTVLGEHTDMVKGLAFDPTGRYLATQSADKTLKVWRTTTYGCVKTLKTLFTESGNTSTALRPSWSPDGSLLLAPNAMNNNGPTAWIINRVKDWRADKDLAGHRKAVSCARWSPKMYAFYPKKPTRLCSLAAIGGRDGAVTVWPFPKSDRPAAACVQIFKHTVTDLAWTPDGLNLLVCSMDGIIGCLLFTPGETGKIIPEPDVHKHISNLYGELPLVFRANGYAGPQTDSALVDSAAVLLARKEAQHKKTQEDSPAKTPTPQRQPSLSAIPNGTVQNGSDKQLEARAKDGRRRITPLFLGSVSTAAASDTSNDQAPNTNISDAVLKSSSRTEKSSIEVQVHPSAPATTASSSTGDDAAAENSDSPDQNRAAPDSPKKRGRKPNAELKLKRKAKQGPPDQPKAKRGRKRKQSFDDDVVDFVAPSISPASRPSSREIARTQRPPSTPSPVAERLILPVPEAQKSLKLDLQKVGSRPGPWTVTLENDLPVGAGVLYSRLSVVAPVEQLWTVMLSVRAELMDGDAHLLAVFCANLTLHIFDSLSGCRLVSPLRVCDRLSVLKCASRSCLVVTCQGFCYLWTFDDQLVPTARIVRQSLAHLVSGNATLNIESVSLTEAGVPIVSLSNGETFAYSFQCQTWLLINDSADQLLRMAPRLKLPRLGAESCPLTQILRQSQPSLASVSCANSLSSGALLSVIEGRCKAALALQSAEEYKFWLMQWCETLVADGNQGKLRELCRQLLGSVHRPLAENEADILGVNKRGLLRQMLPVIATNSNLQRLYTQFYEALNQVDQKNDLL